MKILNAEKNYILSTLQPADYEPPFFRGCTEEEAHNPWTKNPLKMEVGNVNSKHLVLALKVRDESCRIDLIFRSVVHIWGWVLFNWLCLQVKSVLDPCEDENEDIQDDEVSLGADSVQKDDYSESDSEVNWQHYSTFTFSLPFKIKPSLDDANLILMYWFRY